MNYRQHIILLFCVFVTSRLLAGNGTSGFEFLRTDFSARTSAMGGAFVAMRGDINGVFHNPAGLAYTSERQLSLNYVSYLLDINGGQAGYSQRLPNLGQISAAILYFDYGAFDETDQFAQKTGRSYGANDIAIAVSYADVLEQYFSYGVSLKFVNSKIDAWTASALAFDFGLLYEAPFEQDLFFGISLLNVGTALSAFVDTKERLPLSLRVGFAKKLAHLPLEFNAGLNDLNIKEDSIWDRLKKFSLGGEFTLSQMLRLRLGYDNDLHQGLDTGKGAGFAGVSLGFGLLWQDYRFDYSFSSFGDLGATHRFGFFGSL
jgi:hypothetical protein